MPEVWNEFMKGNMAVNQTSILCTSVAMDQALEQTINRSAKNRKSGIIGFTRKKEAVAKWNLTFHESASISKLFRQVTSLNKDNEELKVHHDCSPSHTIFTEEAVSSIIQFLTERCDPFQSGVQPLRNIATSALVDETISKSLLNILESGCDLYDNFRKERIIQKKVPLSAVIHHSKLLTFNSELKNSDKKNDTKEKNVEMNFRRIIDVARVRDVDMKELFCYELVPQNSLFVQNGLLNKQENKSDLIKEIKERYLQSGDYIMPHSEMAMTVDVMLTCRKIVSKNINTFKDYANIFCSIVQSKKRYGYIKRLDFIFDDYFENSIKTCERIRRAGGSEPLPLFNINDHTPFPKQMDKFWNCSKNKQLLQLYLRSFLLKYFSELWPETEVVFSTILLQEAISSKVQYRSNPSLSILQRFDIEEADVKMMGHILDCCQNKIEKIFIFSTDTDILALSLNFLDIFKSNGLKVINFLFIF